MEIVNGGLNLLFLLLAAGIFGMSVYALVHAARVPANAFVSAGKLQKNLWLIILILATLFSAAGAWSYFQAFMFLWGHPVHRDRAGVLLDPRRHRGDDLRRRRQARRQGHGRARRQQRPLRALVIFPG